MKTTAEMESFLKAALEADFVTVADESQAHSGHYDSGGDVSHASVFVVSRHFKGKPVLERHRLVYEALAPQFDKGLHALTIKAYTPEEWDRTNGK